MANRQIAEIGHIIYGFVREMVKALGILGILVSKRDSSRGKLVLAAIGKLTILVPIWRTNNGTTKPEIVISHKEDKELLSV